MNPSMQFKATLSYYSLRRQLHQHASQELHTPQLSQSHESLAGGGAYGRGGGGGGVPQPCFPRTQPS